MGSAQNTDYYVLNNDRVLKLQSGRIFYAASRHSIWEDKSKFAPGELCFFYSDDDGFTWRSTAAKLDIGSNYSTTGLQEPGLAELPGGTVYGYFRTDRMYQYESVSLDGGERWFTPQPSKFTSPASPLLIRRNPFGGKYFAVWNLDKFQVKMCMHTY